MEGISGAWCNTPTVSSFELHSHNRDPLGNSQFGHLSSEVKLCTEIQPPKHGVTVDAQGHPTANSQSVSVGRGGSVPCRAQLSFVSPMGKFQILGCLRWHLMCLHASIWSCLQNILTPRRLWQSIELIYKYIIYILSCIKQIISPIFSNLNSDDLSCPHMAYSA